MKNKKNKELKMGIRKAFSKEDQLFMKKYPRLFQICKDCNINKRVIDKAWKKAKKLRLFTKEEFEISIRMAIIMRIKNHIPIKGSIGEESEKLFKNIFNIK